MFKRHSQRIASNRSREVTAPKRPSLPPQTLETTHAIYNYACDAGGGSQTFSSSDTWRRTLMGTVAAGALFFGYGRSARADCIQSGDTVECSGPLEGDFVTNGGILILGDNTITTLNVNNLDANIMPDVGTKGIYFAKTASDIFINVNNDNSDHDFSIKTSKAHGILANTSGTAKITIDATANISTDGHDADGIHATTIFGDITITQSGDITTVNDLSQGIYARSGVGGSVTIDHTGTITTGNSNLDTGSFSHGLYAFSDIGNAIVTHSGGYIKTSGNQAYGINARTDASSEVGAVTVTNEGAITTYGLRSRGIVAFSNAGDVTVSQTGDITTHGTTADGIFAVSNAANVTVDHQGGTIRTYYDKAMGIWAIANDGHAQINGADSNIHTMGNDASAIFATGNSVTIDRTGSITTDGDNSDAIYAFANSGNVTITQTGDITTHGDHVQAIDAKSLTGDVTVTLADGTISVTGYWPNPTISAISDSGDVLIDGSSDIVVSQTGNAVIYAKSNVGNATVYNTGNITSSIWHTSIWALSYGAEGNVTVTNEGNIISGRYGIRAEAHGGDITITQSGDITTTGDYSLGIFASNSDGGDVTISLLEDGTIQLVGEHKVIGIKASTTGAGGDIKIVQYGDLEVKNNGYPQNTQGISAVSGDGTVDVNSAGKITTNGVGIYATTDGGDITVNTMNVNSIIDAGSDGIFAKSLTGDVTVSQTGDITTHGTTADGIYANSFETIKVTNEGAITTYGNNSHGISAAGWLADVTVVNNGTIKTEGQLAYGINAINNFGNVDITHTGDITVTGDGSFGIWAVSAQGNVDIKLNGGTIYSDLGTGIGLVGSQLVDNSGTLTINGEVTISGGRFDIAAGSGNDTINIFAGATLTTPGIVNLGGGDNAFNILSGGTFNSGSEVNLGLGNWMFNSGTLSPGGDAIEYTIVNGRFVQQPDGTLVVDVAEEEGNITSDFVGATDTASISGTVDVNTIGDLSPNGETEIAEGGTDLFVGQIEVTSGDNRYDFSVDKEFRALVLSWVQAGLNPEAMTWNAAPTIDVSAREDDNTSWTNAGILTPGGDDNVETTEIKGDPDQFTMLQTDTGVLRMDVDLVAGISDQIIVEGDLDVAGGVKPIMTSLAASDADQQTYRLLTAEGTVTDNGLSLLSSVALDATLAIGEDNVDLIFNGIDFTPTEKVSLNANQGSIAKNIQSNYVASGTSADTSANGLRALQLGLLNNTVGEKEYKYALDQLSPQIYLDTQVAALYSSLAFSSALLSCPVNGPDTASINREGECVWANVRWRDLNSNQTAQYIGYDEEAWQFAAGAQFALDPVWRMGFGVGYQTSSLDNNVGAKSDGNQVQGGVVLKYNPGALLIAGMMSGGRGWYDTTRSIDMMSETARSSHNVGILAGRLHASYAMGSPHFYYKPLVDAAVTRVRLGNITEAGAGGANLLAHGSDHTVFSLSPALEVGNTWWQADGTLVRPYARAGVTWFSDDALSVSSSFDGAVNGEAFTIRAGMDDVQADLAAGVEMITGAGQSVRLFYDGHFGDQITVHGFGVKGSARF